MAELTTKTFGTASVQRTPGSKPRKSVERPSYPAAGTLELLRATPPPKSTRSLVSVLQGTYAFPMKTLLAAKKYARDHGTKNKPVRVRGDWRKDRGARTLFVYPGGSE